MPVFPSAARRNSINTCRFAVFLLIGISSGAKADPASLTTFPDSKQVRVENLATVLCSDWVEVRTTSETELSFWDISLSVEPHSRLIIGVNSLYIYAMTLSGEMRAGKTRARPGKILVWSHYGAKDGAPLSFTFAADHLLTAFEAKGHPGDPDLTEIARVQKKKRFWGLLRPTGVNVAQPGAYELEELRHTYQTRPEMIALKRSSRDKEDYALKTAEAFAIALGRGDTRTAALLLSPSLFLQNAAADQTRQLLTEERVAFAQYLIDSDSYREFTSARVEDLGDGQYSVGAGSRTLTITLEPFDDGLYVSSLKPE